MKYFSYANLMDIDYLHRVAPSAKVVGIACLKDYEFSFGVCHDGSHSGARLVPSKGCEIWGVEYELSDSDMAALDESAGVGHGHWAHKTIELHTADGRTHQSMTYDMPNPSAPAGPPAHYVEPALKGARANKLPADYIVKLEALLAGGSARA